MISQFFCSDKIQRNHWYPSEKNEYSNMYITLFLRFDF